MRPRSNSAVRNVENRINQNLAISAMLAAIGIGIACSTTTISDHFDSKITLLGREFDGLTVLLTGLSIITFFKATEFAAEAYADSKHKNICVDLEINHLYSIDYNEHTNHEPLPTALTEFDQQEITQTSAEYSPVSSVEIIQQIDLDTNPKNHVNRTGKSQRGFFLSN